MLDSCMGGMLVSFQHQEADCFPMWLMNQMVSCSGPRPAFPPVSWVSFLMLTQGWDPNCFYLMPPSSAATKTKSRDFPGGTVVKTPAANARGMGSIPSQGTKISYATVQFSCPVIYDSLRPQGLQHARPPCPSITLRGYSNSCPSSQWCHPTISSSVIPFSSHLQSYPASGSLQMSYFFPEGGQSIGVSASASVLPMNIQDWFPLGWSDWISLQSKGIARVFSNTTVQWHQ